MAGIGFILRKLMKKDDLGSLSLAFLHATTAAAGPWIATVLALGSFFLFSQEFVFHVTYTEFRVIIMFNFSLSLVLAAPISNCSTRYLADLLFAKRLNKVVGLMIGMWLGLFALAFLFAWGYYGLLTEMSGEDKYQAVLNFVLIASIWHVSTFLAALKHYKVITFSFFFGMLLSVGGSLYFSQEGTLAFLVGGFNIGLAAIFASLVALVFVEYPPVIEELLLAYRYLTKYWEVALGFFLYSVGLWVDKWIMWFAPESMELPNKMRQYPDYDSAMFTSYLTVIPAMALFLLNQETLFHEVYARYNQGVREHDNFNQIQDNHRRVLSVIGTVCRDLLLVQGIVCLIAIFFAPSIFEILNINLVQIGIFRIGVLGAALQIISLFLMILLSYFDDRKGVLVTQALFCFANIAFTILTKNLGFIYYGYGFFLAALISFISSTLLLERYARELPYHTFVTQNKTA